MESHSIIKAKDLKIGDLFKLSKAKRIWRVLMLLLMMAIIWYGIKIEIGVYNGEFYFEFYLLPLNQFFKS